jgi:plasmid maintenance system antidote protein VapI
MPRPAIHPGKILADGLPELGVTPTELSRQINVPPNRVTTSPLLPLATQSTSS